MKLRCENLVKKYGVRTVVKGVSMEVEQGEIVGFLGPNGAGKTTSFYMITGLIVPNAGKIYLDDEDITGLPMYKRAQKGVGYLAQEASVFRRMTVENNILSVMEMSSFTKAERKERLESLIDEFNLHKVRKSLGIQLSGGERRRCEIARALAIDPKFILLDEPFAGVDPIAVEDIQHIIAKLKYKNIGVIITDHNVGETLAIIDRAYLLYEGNILQSGTPDRRVCLMRLFPIWNLLGDDTLYQHFISWRIYGRRVCLMRLFPIWNLPGDDSLCLLFISWRIYDRRVCFMRLWLPKREGTHPVGRLS